MVLHQNTYPINLRYVLIALAAVLLTFVLHESTHYLTGKLLGYDMWMNLNAAGLVDGQSYSQEWHNQLVSIAGPIITVLQGIAIFIIINKTKNLNWYPFLFVAVLMRIFASAISAISVPNDEARVSEWLGIGKMTLPIVVSLFLVYLLVRTSREQKINLKFNALSFVILSIGITTLIYTNQYFINQ